MNTIYKLINVLYVFILSIYGITFAGVVKEKEFKIDSRTKAILKQFDTPVFKMNWVKLNKGGYMVSGDVSPFDKLNCKYLTDFSFEELEHFLKKEYGYISERIYVKSLNAIVKVNETPILANPYNPAINPTAFKNLEQFNSYLRKEIKKRLKEDFELRKRYEERKRKYMESGLSEREATKKALFVLTMLVDIQPKTWIPEDKLPKNLYLICQYSFAKTDSNFSVKDEWEEYRIYPVELNVINENYIKIKSVEKTEKDIFLEISLYPMPDYTKTRYISLDLLTLNPPKIKIKNCPHGYIGGIIDNGDYRRTEYTGMLSNTDNGFYLVIYTQGLISKIKVRIRLGKYCATQERKRISLLNPVKSDRANLDELIMQNYTFKSFLNKFNLEKSKLNFQIVSPEGYKSDVFTIDFP